MNKNIKLVICDLDGTINQDSLFKPTPYTLDVVERLHQKGILFGIASGREVNQLRALSKTWPLSFEFDVVIGLNGSEYYDLNHDVHNKMFWLRKEDVKEILTKMLEKFPDLNISTYKNGLRYLRYEDESAVASKNKTKMDNFIVPVEEFWREDCSKIMLRIEDEKMMDEACKLAETLKNERYKPTRTHKIMLEFVHAKTAKDVALIDYCKKNDINIEEVAAFGDMDNDIEMIDAAGMGVAMCNGCEGAKKVAKYITKLDNNHDGCAHFIEEYIL